MVKVHVSATVGSNTTLDKFSQILAARMKYLNETAKQSSAACMIDTLKSLRPVTRVFKKSSIKVKLQVNNNLYPSFTKESGKARPALRVKGSKTQYKGDEKVIWPMVITKNCVVYNFTDEYSKHAKKYLIVANTLSDAKKKAKDIVYNRAVRYEKLARSALGVSMHKVGDLSNVSDVVNARVKQKSNDLTLVSESIQENKGSEDGTYTLTVLDKLNYALDAIKGGRAGVNTALKKSMNKIVSVINRKTNARDFFGDKIKLETPFPELRKRK